MRTVEVYHDTRLVFGYEVSYWKDARALQVGHHIGGHITGDVRCDTFVFQEGEFISEFLVSSGDLVDRIEFKTNQGREFKAGGGGGSLIMAKTELKPGHTARFIALGGGLGGHMHNIRPFYVPVISNS